MKAKVITLKFYGPSEAAAEHCIQSAKDIHVTKYSAFTQSAAMRTLSEEGLKWNYPWDGRQIVDIQSGLIKTGYATDVKEKRIACFLSHYFLWKECAETDEDFIILEHDAHFERSVPLDVLEKSDRTVIALNRPQPGATPKADIYAREIRHQIKQGTPAASPPKVYDIPYVNEDKRHPAGLPGNSAYYIKPAGARKLISLAKEYGAWPNDALMCKQLMPGQLGILWPNVTRVQPSISTTTL